MPHPLAQPRSGGATKAQPPKVLPLREHTASMTEVLAALENRPRDRELLDEFLAVLNNQNHVPPQQYNIVTFALGLDDAGDGPRGWRQVALKFGLGTEADAMHRVGVALNNCHHHRVSPQVTIEWLRTTLRDVTKAATSKSPPSTPEPRATTTELARPVPAPQVAPPTNGTITPAPVVSSEERRASIVSTNEAARRLINTWIESRHDNARVDDFLLTLRKLPDRTHELMLFTYGLDDQTLIPKSFGALVERFKLGNADHAETKFREGWDLTHQSLGLGPQVNDRWFRAILSTALMKMKVRPRRPEPPAVATAPQPASPEPARRDPPMAATPPVPLSDQLPTAEDREYFLSRCTDPDDRRNLEWIFDHLTDLSRARALLFTEKFGLIRTTTPLTGEDISKRHGWNNPTTCSQVLAAAWDTFHEHVNGVDRNKKGPWLQALICRIQGLDYQHPGNGALPASARSLKPINNHESAPPTPPIATAIESVTPATAEAAPAAPSEPTAAPAAAPEPEPRPVGRGTDQMRGDYESWPAAFEALSKQRKVVIWLSRQPLRIQAIVRAFYFGTTGSRPNTLREIALIFELPGGEDEVREILRQVREQYRAFLKANPRNYRKE